MKNVKVRFFAYYRELFGVAEKNMEPPGDGTLRGLLDALCDSTACRREIFVGRRLRGHVIIMINGRPADVRRGLRERVHPGDVVAVFPFVGGG